VQFYFARPHIPEKSIETVLGLFQSHENIYSRGENMFYFTMCGGLWTAYVVLTPLSSTM